MRVACVGYRPWALNIYDRLARNTPHHYLIFRSHAQFDQKLVKDFQPDLILFYGWSWHVDDNLINDYRCLMLHPSPLPKYRGGSPLQNQIIAGEIDSKVTIFQMNKETDAGEIVNQEYLSLQGSISDIFFRIEEIGFQLTIKILNSRFESRSQNHKEATYCERRHPRDSEITLHEITHCDSTYLFNKIRMLGDPYPNAFIRTSDGKKLLIKTACIESDELE